MSYTAPPEFAHGDYPTAANLNILSDDLEAIHPIIGDILVETPVRHAYAAGQVFHLVHRFRYLYYDSSGTINDISGINTDESLSDPSSGTGKYDLQQLEWLAIGTAYTVTGVSWCIEGD